MAFTVSIVFGVIMAFWSSLLSQFSGGDICFTISLDGKDVASICIKGKEIIVEIKSALMAIEFGVKEFIKTWGKPSRKIDMSAFENIKKAGYKIVLKYKLLEIEI